MDYCISDIHGYYGLFCRLLEKIGFGGGDRLFVLGDFVDKGPESVRLTKLLRSMPQAVCIAGNHEYDFLKYYRGLMRQTNDYDRVLQSLREYISDGAALDWDTVDWMEFLPFYAETEEFIGVHAGIPLRNGEPLPFDAVTPEQLVYDRRFKEENVLPRGDKCILFGHTPVRYRTGRDEISLCLRPGAPAGSRRIADYCKIQLDTGVYLGGMLGCFAVQACSCFYVRAE